MVVLLNVTGRTVLCLDTLPLISLYRFLVRTSDSLNLMMHGFQRSRSHVPSFGKSFCFINLLQSEFDCYKKNVQSYNKIPEGSRGTLKGCLVYCQGLQPSSYLIPKKKMFILLPCLRGETVFHYPDPVSKTDIMGLDFLLKK